MIKSKKLKIWTIITHAFIVVGAGHGILFLAYLEILSFPYFTKENFNFVFNATIENHFPVIGLATLSGQIALLFSILNKIQNIKILSQIVGIILLWLGLAYFIYDANKDSYIYFSTITCIPFAICTIITFAGLAIRRVYNWILDQ